MFDKLIPVIGVIIGFLLGLLGNWIQRKGDAEERFFYEVYNRRISLYEDAIKELYAMQTLEFNKIKNISGIEASKIIIERLQILDALIARLILFGSANSRETIKMLRKPMLELQGKALIDPQGNGSEVITALCNIIETTTRGFIIVVSQDVSDLADEKIAKFLKKIGYKSKKPGKEEKEEENKTDEEKQN